MAKKTRKDEVPNPNSVTNRDILQRLNYLFQASVFLQSISEPPTVPPADHSGTEEPENNTHNKTRHHLQTKKKPKTAEERAAARTARRTRTIASSDIAKCYVRDMRQIGRKATVRMDPSVKRALCQVCDAVLISGVSATIRVNPSGPHGQIMATKCLQCGKLRHIPAPPILEQREHSPSTIAVSGAGDVEMAETLASAPNRQKGLKRTKKGPKPRPPPLFERDGHVVFRGNDRILPPSMSRS